MRVYICGPIAGHPDLNRASFERAAAFLKERGDTPVNPHDIPVWEHEGECPPVYGYKNPGAEHDGGCYLRTDIAVMVTCERIYRLKGWQKSFGASKEVIVAELLKMFVEDEA